MLINVFLFDQNAQRIHLSVVFPLVVVEIALIEPIQDTSNKRPQVTQNYSVIERQTLCVPDPILWRIYSKTSTTTCKLKASIDLAMAKM